MTSRKIDVGETSVTRTNREASTNCPAENAEVVTVVPTASIDLCLKSYIL